MKAKLLSAFLSATTLSAIMTFLSQQNQTAEKVYYYPTMYTFYVGSAILLSIFIFLAIPLSLVADMIIYHRLKQNSKNVLAKSLLSILFAIAVGVILLLFKHTFDIKIVMKTLFYFGFSGGIFLFYELAIGYLRQTFLVKKGCE